jgi:hypothetical protein
MPGGNLSACRVSKKGAGRQPHAASFSFSNPLENQSDKSQGYGGGAPEHHLL